MKVVLNQENNVLPYSLLTCERRQSSVARNDERLP